jgi:outer membrane immunogenic protein
VGAVCPVGPSLPFVFNSPSGSTFLSGWTAGAGVEWGFLPNWTLRAEYLHLQFNGVAENFGFTGITIGVPIVSNVHNTTNNGIDVARVGVSYLFNWGPRY